MKTKKLLFAKNDSRFCQIVWRKLHRNFVSRHDSDEMLPHFTRNMRKHIALAGKIDAEHRPGNTCVTVPSVTICSSFAIARRIYSQCTRAQGVDRPAAADRRQVNAISSPNLTTVQRTVSASRYGGTGPAKSSASIREAPLVSTTRPFGEAPHCCKSIAIKHRANVIAAVCAGMGCARATPFTSCEPCSNRTISPTTTDFLAEFPERRTTSASRVSVGAARTSRARVSRRPVSI